MSFILFGYIRLPPIEAILELLLLKTKAEERLKEDPLILVNDVTSYLSGNTISFLEFTQVDIYILSKDIPYN